MSRTINDNLKILLFYKNFKENKFNYSFDYIYFYEQSLSEETIDPSFINCKLKLILEKNFEKDLTIPENEISNIYYQIVKYMEKNISIAYLPKIDEKTKKTYFDGKYIEDNLINEENYLNQTIDYLICILDDNEYYNKVKGMNKNIYINKIYFLLRKGKKQININDAINSYLKKINSHSVIEIIFGEEFFNEKIIEINDFISYKSPILDFLKKEVFLMKKTFVLPELKSIKLNSVDSMSDKKLFYLGLSLLFPNSNINIEGVTIIDSKKDKNIIQKLDEYSGGTLILKIHSFSFLEMIFKEYLNIKKVSSLIIYIGKEIIKNDNKENINEIYSKIIKAKSLLLYSEVPLKGFDVYINNEFGVSITTIKDINNGLLLLEKERKIKLDFNDYFFLIKKYHSLLINKIHYCNIFTFICKSNNLIIIYNRNIMSKYHFSYLQYFNITDILYSI